MDKKPKINIRVKQDRAETSQKLTFSAQSQEAARIRIDEELKRKESVPFKVMPVQNTPPISSIYQKLFEPKAEVRENTKPNIEDKGIEYIELKKTGQKKQEENYWFVHSSEGHLEMDEQGDRDSRDILDDPMDMQEDQRDIDEENNEAQYPFFPGIYPSLYRPDEFLHKEREWKPKYSETTREDDPYLDLGPIYQEEEPTPQKPTNKFRTVNFSQKRDSFPTSFNRSKAKDGLKLAAAILGAVGLGSLFGYLLLLFLLSGDGVNITKESPAAREESSQQGTRVIPADKVELDLSGGGKVATGKLTVTDRTFFAIQAGVFTEEKSGNEAYTGLQQKNLPILLFNDDVYRLFLGIGYQEEDSQRLRDFFNKYGTETYLKKYTIAGGTLTIPEASSAQMEVLNKYFTHGTYLLEKTAAWTSEALKGNVQITDEAWRKFKETHQLFLTEANEVAGFLPSDQKQWASGMMSNMDKAVLAMVDFIEHHETAKLIESQQCLLNYFEGYRSFLKSSGINVVMK